jgi:hypothetical protein
MTLYIAIYLLLCVVLEFVTTLYIANILEDTLVREHISKRTFSGTDYRECVKCNQLP